MQIRRKRSSAYFRTFSAVITGLLTIFLFLCLGEGPGVLQTTPAYGQAQAQAPLPPSGPGLKMDHPKAVADQRPCLECHDKPAMGYRYVNKARFRETRHFKNMLRKGIEGSEQACLSCHVSKEGKFTVNPAENWYDGAGDIEAVSNDMGGTCGKCHEEIAKRFAKSLHAMKKAVYFSLRDLPPPGAEKGFGISPFAMYSKACGTCHASCSSCHLIGKDRQVIDWKYVQAHAQTRIGTIDVPIAKGVTGEARILSLGPNRNPKSGGPLYRNMARQGLVPLETVKFDIESHDFTTPGRLEASRANDICYRCHENPGKEFYGIGLDNSYGYSSHARAGMKCIDCHGRDEVHGSGAPELYISKALQVRCKSCHLRDEKAPPHLASAFVAQAKKVELTGAHRNLQCSVCHARFYGSCVGCHKDRKARYIETDRNTGRPLVYFGRDVGGKVQIVTTAPRRMLALDEKTDGGIWMMQSRHSIQKSVYQACEDCHIDPVKMGVDSLDRPILNTWEMASIGVPGAFIRKEEHLARVKAGPQQTCSSCHAPQARNRYEQFHLTGR